jgi:hypothetical protein
MVFLMSSIKRFTIYFMVFLILAVLAIKIEDHFSQPEPGKPFLACAYGNFVLFYSEPQVRKDYDLDETIGASCFYCLEELMVYKHHVYGGTNNLDFAISETISLSHEASDLMRASAEMMNGNYDSDQIFHEMPDPPSQKAVAKLAALIENVEADKKDESNEFLFKAVDYAIDTLQKEYEETEMKN